MISPDDVGGAPALPWSSHPTKWLAAIVESSDDAIVGKTLDSTVRSWNAGAHRIFGYAAEEIIGRSVLVLIPPELHDEERTIVDQLANGLRVEPFETVRLRRDGSRIDVSLSVSPICDERGKVIGAAKIARDVTEANRLRRAEHELSEQLQEQALELEHQIEEAKMLQDELEFANHELQRAVDRSRDSQERAEEANSVKSRFLATMSHELRTPLNAIAGYVDLLDVGVHGPLSDEQRADLARIKQNQRTLLRLIEDILDYAKLESGRMRYHVTDVPVDDVLKTLEAFVAPSLQQKGLDYHFEPCGPDVKVRADRGKVEQVLLNLLSNAVKCTDHGSVTVRCDARDHVVEVSVRDTGHGIPEDSLDAIFEPFIQEERLTRRPSGTGLGLSISRQLARDMGGEILVSSGVDRGSTFTLVLPRVDVAGREPFE